MARDSKVIQTQNNKCYEKLYLRLQGVAKE